MQYPPIAVPAFTSKAPSHCITNCICLNSALNPPSTPFILIICFASVQKSKQPGALRPLDKGNPAVHSEPVAFRPHLTMGLALLSPDCAVQKKTRISTPRAMLVIRAIRSLHLEHAGRRRTLFTVYSCSLRHIIGPIRTFSVLHEVNNIPVTIPRGGCSS